jgi:ABC-2 type transport system permease protein
MATSAGPVEPHAVSAEPFAVLALFRETAAITQAELKKLFRDPTELFSRAIQPVLWLVIFGQVFSKVRGIPTGNVSYLAFMTPGILAQSVLFTAIFYGIAVIWERDLGIIHKLLVSPAHRSALVIGKAASAGVRGAIQAFIIYLVALAMRIPINWNPLAIAGVLFAVAMGAAVFSTFSLVIACIVKSRERFMGIGQVLTMPLFFASSAIYPLAMMPGWLQVVARLNPLTYLVDALRGIMIRGGQSVHPLIVDIGVMALVFVVLASIASKLYPTLVR